jgi:hypothetical protein
LKYFSSLSLFLYLSVDAAEYYEQIQENLANAPIDIAAAAVNKTIDDLLLSLGITKVDMIYKK